MARRIRSGGLAAGVIVTVVLLGAVAWTRLVPPGPLDRGRAAYERGEWSSAAALARETLKERPGDLEALRLLARSYGRMERDDKTLELYARLGNREMRAEDYFVLGSGLNRGNQPEQAVAALEQGRKLDPDHAETLDALARVYARLGRMDDATGAAARLATVPGWEARGGVALGVLREERADHAGASLALAAALQADPVLRGAGASAPVVRKLLARTLLQTSQPGQARTFLEPVLAGGPDVEASWLLSRSFLQEGQFSLAAQALTAAGSYGRDDPTRPEPAAYVGAKACARCHADIHRSEQSSRHGRTLYRATDLDDIPLPKAPVADPVVPEVTHALTRDGRTLRLETRAGASTWRAVIEYGLGSGAHGLTMIGRDEAGRDRVLRLSSFEHNTLWDLTPNAPAPSSSDPASVIGRLLTADVLASCLDCHVTTKRAAADPSVPEAADHGIGCERCHGPGGNHLAAMAAGFDDPAIARPRLASAPQITRLCASCHRADGPEIREDDPLTIRFQGVTLPQSRCYTESGGGLSCLTCHDPHRDAETSASQYEVQCLACHADVAPKPSRATRHAVLAAGSRRIPCPVNPVDGCLKCHMPTTHLATHHASFTDHQIRVHRTQKPAE